MATLTETLAVAVPMESPLHSRLIRTQRASSSRPLRAPLVVVESSNRQKAKATVRLDPVRILEPARKKLSTLEAQRVMGAMRDAVRRAEIVVSLPFVLRRLDDHRSLFGDDVLRVLESHRALLTASGSRALEEMFCETADQQPPSARSGSYGSRDGESERTDRGAEDDDSVETVDEPHSGKDRRRISGKYSGEFRKRGQSSELDGRSGETGRLTDVDDLGSEWQSRDQTDLDGHSELERQTMTASKSSRDAAEAYSDEEEEEAEEEGEEEWDEGNEMSSASKGTIRERSLRRREETEISQLFDRTSKSSASLGTGLRERTRTRMDLPPQNLTTVVESCRSVLRSFPLNQKPVLEVLKECEGSWKEKSSEMIQCLRDLCDIVMTKLLVSPVEEMEKTSCLRELLEKERYNSDVIAKLSAELNAAEDGKNEAIRKQNDIIRKLQATLHSIEKTSEDSIRRTKLEAEKQETADRKNAEGKLAKLQQDLSHVLAQYNNLKEEHRDKELALRRRKFQVETEVENWIQKFDVDMGERQNEYERIDLIYTEEKRQLTELEEKFKRLDAEYQQIQEEKHMAREKRGRAERELMMRVRAATTIQAFWRSFKVRKAIKAKKKKKKKTTTTKKGVKKGKK